MAFLFSFVVVGAVLKVRSESEMDTGHRGHRFASSRTLSVKVCKTWFNDLYNCKFNIMPSGTSDCI